MEQEKKKSSSFFSMISKAIKMKENSDSKFNFLKIAGIDLGKQKEENLNNETYTF